MKQEIWITIRFKGEIDAALDADEAANSITARLVEHINADASYPGGFAVHAHDVIEVEEEADIYEHRTIEGVLA